MHHNDQEILEDGTEVFFVLLNQQLLRLQKHTPESFYIKGQMAGGKFVPQTDILGNGELAKSGQYGWLELESREFHSMESDKRATTPFVKGYMTRSGFQPSLRDVFSEP